MGALTIAITGASGRLGKATLQAAEARGHRTIALTRRDADLSCDLPAELFAGVDAIVHLAAAVSNAPEALQRDTILATGNLLSLLQDLGTKPRLVLASSIALYDADLPEKSNITEDSPLEKKPTAREPYISAKLKQEALCRASSLPVWALRIGAIYSAGDFWNAHIGFRSGRTLLSLSRKGDLPMVHIKDAAEALVLAAEQNPPEAFVPINIVEEPAPKRNEVIRALKRQRHVPISWKALMPLAFAAEAALGSRAPGLLRPRVLKARMASRKYPTCQARSLLGWASQRCFTTAIQLEQG